MKLAVAAALALLALPSAASAGGYVSAGIGTGPAFGGELENAYTGDDHNSARVLVGKRFGIVGIEAGIGGWGLTGTAGNTLDVVSGRAYSAQAAVTVSMPLVTKLDGYLRVGIEKIWVTGEQYTEYPVGGGGYLLGAGIAYDLGVRDAALWLEANHELIHLGRPAGTEFDGTVSTLLAGIRVGFGR